MTELIGYEGLYTISQNGDIYSFVSKKIIKHYRDKRNFMLVTLFKDRKSKIFLVHRLLAIHFIPNNDNLEFVTHINNDNSDNTLTNLRWCTPRDTHLSRVGQSIYGHNISLTKNGSFKFAIQINGKMYTRPFLLLQQAVEFRDKIFESLGNVDLSLFDIPRQNESPYGKYIDCIRTKNKETYVVTMRSKVGTVVRERFTTLQEAVNVRDRFYMDLKK